MKILRAAALVALGVALALAFVKSTMPMDREPQTEREASADTKEWNPHEARDAWRRLRATKEGSPEEEKALEEYKRALDRPGPSRKGVASKIQLDDGTWQFTSDSHWKVEDARGCPDDENLPCPPIETQRPEPTPDHVRVWCKKNPDYCRRIAR